jgi:hypothetical protein
MTWLLWAVIVMGAVVIDVLLERAAVRRERRGTLADITEALRRAK